MVARSDANMGDVSIDGIDSSAGLWKSGGDVLTANYGSRAISDNDANQPYVEPNKHKYLASRYLST